MDDTSDITENALLQLIVSRMDCAPAGIARLKRVRFAFDRPCPSGMDIMPAFSTAIADGFRVQIIYRDAEPLVTKLFSINPRDDLELAAHPRGWERGFCDSHI